MPSPRRLHSEMSKTDTVRGVDAVLGEVFKRLAEQRESLVEEGHLMPDHVHRLLRMLNRPGFVGGYLPIFLLKKENLNRLSICAEFHSAISVICLREFSGS